MNITCCNLLGISRIEHSVLCGYTKGLFGLLLASSNVILKSKKLILIFDRFS